ncbi:MAG: cadmium-translocating P-type ATPase [Nitrospirales bacterium]|nr:cadmium-translocating P-type ATPase [Nitrospirales bacterium]
MKTLLCSHCLLPFPEKDAIHESSEGQDLVFCCHGCQGIYRLIHSEGLDSFYEKRHWDEAGVSRALFERELDLKPFTPAVRDVEVRDDEGVKSCKELDIVIDGIRCASCVWLNERILGRTTGISYARVNYATHKARIRWDPQVTGMEQVLKRIVSIGYTPKPYSETEQFKAQKSEARDLLVRFGTAAFFSSQLMVYSIALYAGYFQGIDSRMRLILEVIAMLLTVPVIFYSGMPFIRSTIRGLKSLRFTMDSLITIGAGSAFVYSIYEIFTGGKVYFDTAAMIITLILLGRFIETTAKGSASSAIQRLTELSPLEATKLAPSSSGYEREVVPVSTVKAGDLLEVLPGERIPLDGVVVEGESEVDEALLTGESRPIMKTAGSAVIGGSINLYGRLIFRVTKTGRETVLSQIIQAVEDAQTQKPRLQRVADRVVGVFVPAILVISLATVIFHLLRGMPVSAALMAGVSVLVIACPCSLGLATPVAVLVFTTMASSKGMLIRGGEVIENASRISRVIFDKTGTITVGRPVLKDWMVFDKKTAKDDLLILAASLERLSGHSIGHAITEAAGNSPLYEVEGFRVVPGRGIEGTVKGKMVFIGNRGFMAEQGLAASLPALVQELEERGDTVVLMGWDGAVRGLFVISDIIREEASQAVQDLRSLGVSVSVASGDNRTTTQTMASAVGIRDFSAETSPVMKREIIHSLQKEGQRVMMVGDGINDAPALAESSVGVAMGRGTDIAMESADAVLVRNDLRIIPSFISMAGKTYRIIKQNIFWAFFYNVVAIPLAISGVLHPIIAAAAMASSSLFVVGNSLRIRRAGK